MTRWRSIHRVGRRRLRRLGRLAGEVVLQPVSAMRSGQVLACSVSLLAAGVLLTRGFIGLVPGRPAFVLLGVLLACSAVFGLGIDHVEVRSSSQRPDHVLIDEVNRSRRFGHQLSLVAIRCDEEAGRRVVSRMRGTDRAWRQRDSIIAMLPETDSSGTADFVRRIADLAPIEGIRVSTFPDDAVTVDGLYEALHQPEPLRPLAVVPDQDRDRAVGEA